MSGGWDYLEVSRNATERLSELASAGWELVGVTGDAFHLKRAKRSFRDQVTLDQKRRYYGEWGLPVAEDEEGLV